MLGKIVTTLMLGSLVGSTSMFLSLKNDFKIFMYTKTYEEGGLALKWLLLKHTTLDFIIWTL